MLIRRHERERGGLGEGREGFQSGWNHSEDWQNASLKHFSYKPCNRVLEKNEFIDSIISCMNVTPAFKILNPHIFMCSGFSLFALKSY